MKYEDPTAVSSSCYEVTFKPPKTALNLKGSLCILASLVTALGRCLLNKLINIASQGKGEVYYCDTDSLKTNMAGYTNLKNM